MSDLMREEFEKRFPVPRGVEWRDYAYHIKNEKQCSLTSHIFYLGRWETWQASRECLAIELPKENSYVQSSETAMFFLLEDVREAIHAAGVKTK